MVSRTAAADRSYNSPCNHQIRKPYRPPISAVAPAPDFRGRWWIRIALFMLHIAILVAAMSLTPPGYFFELGAFTGSILLFSSILLWWLLCSAKTRRGILLYCILALVQAGFMALVGLHFRGEDRALQSIMMLYVARAPSPPLIQFLPVRVHRGTTRVLVTQDGQSFVLLPSLHRSEERRVGKECRSR